MTQQPDPEEQPAAFIDGIGISAEHLAGLQRLRERPVEDHPLPPLSATQEPLSDPMDVSGKSGDLMGAGEAVVASEAGQDARCCPGHGTMAHVRGCVKHPETPQDAREVEREAGWWALVYNRVEPFHHDEQTRLVRELIALADREHAEREAALVAERDALQRDLAQAVSERDRLRAGIEALHHSSVEVPGWCHEEGFSWPCPTARLLTTPDADAQDERPTMTDAASVGLGSHESAWVNDPTPADWADAQDEGVLP